MIGSRIAPSKCSTCSTCSWTFHKKCLQAGICIQSSWSKRLNCMGWILLPGSFFPMNLISPRFRCESKLQKLMIPIQWRVPQHLQRLGGNLQKARKNPEMGMSLDFEAGGFMQANHCEVSPWIVCQLLSFNCGSSSLPREQMQVWAELIRRFETKDRTCSQFPRGMCALGANWWIQVILLGALFHDAQQAQQ